MDDTRSEFDTLTSYKFHSGNWIFRDSCQHGVTKSLNDRINYDFSLHILMSGEKKEEKAAGYLHPIQDEQPIFVLYGCVSSRLKRSFVVRPADESISDVFALWAPVPSLKMQCKKRPAIYIEPQGSKRSVEALYNYANSRHSASTDWKEKENDNQAFSTKMLMACPNMMCLFFQHWAHKQQTSAVNRIMSSIYGYRKDDGYINKRVNSGSSPRRGLYSLIMFKLGMGVDLPVWEITIWMRKSWKMAYRSIVRIRRMA